MCRPARTRATLMPMERLVLQRVARRSDLPDSPFRDWVSEAWSHLARLLDSACTKPEWILLGFEAGALASVLVLAAPSEFNLPLEIIRLHGGLDARNRFSSPFPARRSRKPNLSESRELYCTVPEDSSDASVLLQAGFRRWRKVVRFESAGPVDLKCGVIDPRKSAILRDPK